MIFLDIILIRFIIVNVGGDSIIKFINVSKQFTNEKEVNQVLNNISFSVEKGSIYGIVGNTGSGKSTILKMINGFLLADQGTVLIDNIVVTENNQKDVVKKTSFIFQHYNLLKNLNVLDNVALPLKLKKVDKKTREEKALKMLDYVGLKNFVKSYPKTLSGGEKQRVAIARSLMTEPDILIMDEPTSALDQKMSLEILDILIKINAMAKTTMVIVSHDLELLKSISDQVMILENNQVLEIININKTKLINKSYKERLE